MSIEPLFVSLEATGEYCRLCATRTPPLRLRSFATSGVEADSLLASIRCLEPSIYRADGLPQLACLDCLQQLNAVDVFQRSIAAAQVKLTEILMMGTLQEDRFMLKEECTLKEEAEGSDSSNDGSRNSNKDDFNMSVGTLKYEVNIKVDQLKADAEDGNVVLPYAERDNTVEPSRDSTLMAALNPFPEKSTKPAHSSAELSLKKKIVQKRSCKRPQNAEPSASSSLPTRRTAPTPSAEPGPRWSEYLCCRRCDLRFDSLQLLREHSWTEHARCIAFKCDYCPRRILTFKHFYQHLPRHVTALRHCCEFCNKCFEFVADVKLHKKLLHADEKKAHRCVICGMKFSTAAELKTHRDNYTIVSTSTAGGRNFKCSLCPKTFPNKIGLVGHMNYHDPTKYVCNLCNKSYKSNYILNQHLNTVHKDTLNFICHICGKGFMGKSDYRGHIDIHNGVKRFSCDTCPKKFRNKKQLRAHLVSHTQKYSHVCHICNKAYKYISSLKEHLNSHNKERPYACDVCPKTFLSWGNFNKHMKRIHDRNMSKKNQLLVIQYSDPSTTAVVELCGKAETEVGETKDVLSTCM